MSHPDAQPFSIKLDGEDLKDPKTMEDFNKLMETVQDETAAYIDKLAYDLNVSGQCAGDVWYLRTRSRWTQRAEDELIRLHKAGSPPPVLQGWPFKDSDLRD